VQQRPLGLGLDELAGQPWRIARKRLDRRQRETQRRRLKCGDATAAHDGPGGRGQVCLGKGRALKKRFGVPDQHEHGVGQAHTAARRLQQAHAGLTLKDRKLLRYGRRSELQRIGDRCDGSALAQFA
jgi:hypothetical protein